MSCAWEPGAALKGGPKYASPGCRPQAYGAALKGGPLKLGKDEGKKPR